jgi:hypothetical protein
MPGVMTKAAIAACLLVPVLTGCSTSEGGAMVACEQLINQRLGAEVEHQGPRDGATVEGEGPYVVRSSYTEPTTRRTTSYTCTVERTEGGWRLVDLATDR